MCGIVGLVHHDAPSPVTRDVFCRLVRGVAHRGPDGSGTVFERDFTFGHTRLNVIDLSEAASQPMTDAEGRVVITYNGEIYNFRELRAELAALGHTFRTRSDTEVILEACKEWGPAALERLRGMCAFGLFENCMIVIAGERGSQVYPTPVHGPRGRTGCCGFSTDPVYLILQIACETAALSRVALEDLPHL